MPILVAPLVAIIVSTAVSLAAQFLMNTLNKPKVNDPEGKFPGSSIGIAIPQVFGDAIVDKVMWVEPNKDGRAFVQNDAGDEKRLFLTAIGCLAESEGNATLHRLWIGGNEEVNFQAQEDAIFLGEDPNDPDTLDVISDSQDFYDRNIDWHPGNLIQQPFPQWVSEYGVNNLIAYRPWIAIGFYSLRVDTRGLSFPNLRALIRTENTYTTGDIIKIKAVDSGIDETLVDITECTDSVIGFKCDRSGSSYLQEIEDLLVGHFIGVVELPDGTISFRKLKRDQIKLDINLGDLGSRAEGDQLDSLIERSVDETRELPRSVIFNFVERGKGYSTGSVISEEHPEATSFNVERISTEEIMTRTTAKVLADKLLYQIWERYVKYSFTLPFSYKSLIDTLDVITINGGVQLQIISMVVTANWLIRVEAYRYNPVSLEFSSDGVNAVATSPYTIAFDDSTSSNTTPGEVELLDLPLAFSNHSQLGLYIISNNSGNLLFSTDGGNNYNTYSISGGNSYGTVDGVLGYETKDINGTAYPINHNLATSDYPLLDDTTDLIVNVTSGSFSSISQSQFDNEEVLMFVGSKIGDKWEGEFIAALISIPLGNNQVQFFDLKRGLKGTEHYIDKHVAGETIFLINTQSDRQIITQNQLNNLLFFKYQESNEDVSGVTPGQLIYAGEDIANYPPIDLTATLETNSDITFAVTLRPRPGNFAYGDQQVAEIDVLDASDNVVRTLTGSLVYTLADQTTDGLVSPFKLKAYQINSLVGRSEESIFVEITPV